MGCQGRGRERGAHLDTIAFRGASGRGGGLKIWWGTEGARCRVEGVAVAFRRREEVCVRADHCPVREQPLRRIVKRFRGGIVFKAHRLSYLSTLGSRVIKKPSSRSPLWNTRA